MLKPSAETLWARRILAADPKFAPILKNAVVTADAVEAADESSGGEVIAFAVDRAQARTAPAEALDAAPGGSAAEQLADSPKGTSPSRIA